MAKNEDNDIVKGLFFGVLLGLGLAWFLTTPEGETFKKKIRAQGGDLMDRARNALDETLKEDFVDVEIEEKA
jgi:hypothetical protein